MTKSKIETIRDWSDSRRKPTKQRISVSTYTKNVASEPQIRLI